MLVRRSVLYLKSRRTATTFLTLLIGAVLTSQLLPATRQRSVHQWASTSVHNLRTHPLGAVVLSPFIPSASSTGWILLAALGMFTADALFGWRRSLLLVVSAHVAGTLISEGIVAWRVTHGALPTMALRQDDVGPSYVVVCALTLAMLYGWYGAARPRDRISRPLAGAAGLIALRHILFADLSQLDVSAIGHVVSVFVAAVGGAALLRRGARLAGQAKQ